MVGGTRKNEGEARVRGSREQDGAIPCISTFAYLSEVFSLAGSREHSHVIPSRVKDSEMYDDVLSNRIVDELDHCTCGRICAHNY